eukprot:CAMPEP_0196726336 /NCGR_PEP_ID=MMETSP1091-20130531/7636_1 /TAXON_ID=302021 /ORGANISM="Rhodomonas sp., Strain CCMP768" /LENGTH=165 /DNA_ID=CAMNT_0042068757 /DNA_START=66 /DNA_END=563 /DNA_ORIENTATION=-
MTGCAWQPLASSTLPLSHPGAPLILEALAPARQRRTENNFSTCTLAALAPCIATAGSDLIARREPQHTVLKPHMQHRPSLDRLAAQPSKLLQTLGVHDKLRRTSVGLPPLLLCLCNACHHKPSGFPPARDVVAVVQRTRFVRGDPALIDKGSVGSVKVGDSEIRW